MCPIWKRNGVLYIYISIYKYTCVESTYSLVLYANCIFYFNQVYSKDFGMSMDYLLSQRLLWTCIMHKIKKQKQWHNVTCLTSSHLRRIFLFGVVIFSKKLSIDFGLKITNFEMQSNFVILLIGEFQILFYRVPHVFYVDLVLDNVCTMCFKIYSSAQVFLWPQLKRNPRTFIPRFEYNGRQGMIYGPSMGKFAHTLYCSMTVLDIRQNMSFY